MRPIGVMLVMCVFTLSACGPEPTAVPSATPQATPVATASGATARVAPMGCPLTTAQSIAAEVTLGPAEGLPASPTKGEPLVVVGTVYAKDCTPLPDVTLELWQTDGEGVYGPGHGSDDMQCCYFQGTVTTDAGGHFRIRTVRPGHYFGEPEPPPAHIHVRVLHAQGEHELEFVFRDDPHLPGDPVNNGLLPLTFVDGVAIGDIVLSEVESGATSGALSDVAAMREPRAAHTATLLADGRVLLAGGFKDDGHGDELALASAELFDPATDSFALIGPLTEPRNGHTATRLADGRVLLVGGWGNDTRLSTAEIFDPRSGAFASTGSLGTRRANHTATLLSDGRVLIAGGSSARNVLLPNAEVYDPASGAFAPAPALIEAREGHTATLLPDGRVLLVGGTGDDDRVLASAEVFDPATNTFKHVGDLGVPRRKHATVLVPDGRVLIIGGSDARDWRGMYTSTEFFDPATNSFTAGPALNHARFKLADAAVLLADGRVLVGGGHARMELFGAGRFIEVDSLDEALFFSTATLLADGRVLITGGYNRDIVATARAWVFR